MGTNDIEFMGGYYQNNRIVSLASGLTRNKDWGLIFSFVFIVITFLAYLFYNIYLIFSPNRKSASLLNIFVVLVGFTFLIGLSYYILQTSQSKGFLILFGLVNSAKAIFYLVPIFLLLCIFGSYQVVRKKQYSYLNISVCLGYIFLLVKIIQFQLFSNF